MHPYLKRRDPNGIGKYLILCFLIVLACCNPTQKVMNDPAKTARVVDNYIKNHSIKDDTSFKAGKFISDTAVQYDTSYLSNGAYILTPKGDTAYKKGQLVMQFDAGIRAGGDYVSYRVDTILIKVHDTVKITKTVYITKQKVDTVTVSDNRALEACQKLLNGKDVEIAAATQWEPKADLWKLRFMLLLGSIAAVTTVGVILAVKKKLSIV